MPLPKATPAIRGVWNGNGRSPERVGHHCGNCNQAFTSPADCRCTCHQPKPTKTGEKQ